VSVGMLFDPTIIVREPLAVFGVVALILVGKSLVALGLVLALGYPLSTGLTISAALAQVGEFSFILASLGAQLGVMPAEAVNTLVATAIVSITLNPLLYRSIDAWERWLVRRLPAADQGGDEEPASEQAPTQRAIVVGYGPVGQTVTQLLLDNEIEPTVIELNLDTVRRLRAFDVRAIYGDASRPEVLAEAGAARAVNLILTSGTGSLDEEIIRRAKEFNPGIHVLARTQYVRELPKLQRAGAEDVFAAEGEVALAFTARILERLGASGEQIDRERQRVEATFRSG